MQRIIAELLRVGEDAVSIKATTNERMGYVGREEGVCAYAVALVQRKG
jgi:2-C-methyl-D-erythritol 2,4-cyclodiphosphate synthase